jgi:hypothetical protein
MSDTLGNSNVPQSLNNSVMLSEAKHPRAKHNRPQVDAGMAVRASDCVGQRFARGPFAGAQGDMGKRVSSEPGTLKRQYRPHVTVPATRSLHSASQCMERFARCCAGRDDSERIVPQ